MNKEKFDKIIKKREFWAQFQEADPDSLDKIREELTELMSQNIDDTINFMKNNINGTEFVWISEVFDDIADKTQSREFINALYEIAKKFPEETKKYYIIGSIEFADEFIEDEESKEK